MTTSSEGTDEVLKQLIETNIRQRGIGNTNAVKLGRCLRELDRIYNVKQGKKVQNALFKTQNDLADEIGISIDAYKRYESLTNLIPELADMVDNGLNVSSAVSIARKLSPEEQKQLAEQLIGKDKVSGAEVQKYIDGSGGSSDEFRRNNLHRAYGRSSGRPKIVQPDYSTCGALPMLKSPIFGHLMTGSSGHKKRPPIETRGRKQKNPFMDTPQN